MQTDDENKAVESAEAEQNKAESETVATADPATPPPRRERRKA